MKKHVAGLIFCGFLGCGSDNPATNNGGEGPNTTPTDDDQSDPSGKADGPGGSAAPKAPKKVVVDEATRLAMIREGDVLDPTQSDKKDPFLGPQDGPHHAYNERLKCDFSEPKNDDTVSGWTRKFECKLANGQKVKVKYDRANPEVYTEVLVSRLLWNLGFAADRYYPVVIECNNCPEDPYKYNVAISKAKDAAAKDMIRASTAKAQRVFDPAIIEYKLGTETETTDGKEGFRFDTELLREFSKDPAIAQEQKIQREALTLLMAALLHVDNKQENQRIACAPGTVVVEDGVAKCDADDSLLYVQDVGATLGLIHLTPDIRINTDVGFRYFVAHPVWAPIRKCTAVVTSGAPNATLRSASISEAGRAFLAQRLSQLTRADIRAIVEASQIEKLGGPSVDNWTDALVGKVKEIEKPCAK